MEALTAAEIVALFGLDERRIRKDVEHGIVGSAAPPRFRFPDVVYFVVVRDMGLELSVADRKKVHDLVARALESARAPADVPRTIELTAVIDLKLGTVVRSTRTRLSRFEAWKCRLVEDPAILGGEPVLPKSRLAVRHLGDMLRGSVAASEVREDYPYVTDEDIEFAPLYALAYPRVGRPRADQTSSR